MIKKKNRPILFAFIITIAAVCFLAGQSFAFDSSLWNNQRSDHFIIYYHEANPSYISEILSKAESYYKSITEDFGFTRYGDFWTWDNRAKIYVYDDSADYQKSTNNPNWSAAAVNVVKREIYAYINMKDFHDSILPHEMAHIIFREFTGFRRNYPLWLEEGIACYTEKRNREERLRIARGLVRSKIFVSLENLQKIRSSDILLIPDVFYAEAASVIDFLLKDYGKEKFIEFLRRLRDMRDDQGWLTALKEVYKFKNLDEMNLRWSNFLFKEGL